MRTLHEEIADAWLQVAIHREAAGDLEGAERARRNADIARHPIHRVWF